MYAPGLLAASPGIAPGDRVAVSVALERPQPARRRGGQAAGRQQQHQEEEEEQQQHGDAMGVPADGDLDGSVGSLEDEAGKPAGASGSISDSDCSTDGFSTRGSTSTSSSGGQGTAKKKRGGGGSGGARWVVGINRGSVVERDGSVRLVGVGPARGGRRKDTSHHHALHGSARAGSTSISSTVTSSTRSSASASAPPAADGVDDAREALDGDGGGAVAVSRRSDRVYAGVAVAAAGRRALFRQEQGLALQMEERVFDVPSCNGGWLTACHVCRGAYAVAGQQRACKRVKGNSLQSRYLYRFTGSVVHRGGVTMWEESAASPCQLHPPQCTLGG